MSGILFWAQCWGWRTKKLWNCAYGWSLLSVSFTVGFCGWTILLGCFPAQRMTAWLPQFCVWWPWTPLWTHIIPNTPRLNYNLLSLPDIPPRPHHTHSQSKTLSFSKEKNFRLDGYKSGSCLAGVPSAFLSLLIVKVFFDQFRNYLMLTM